MQYSCIYEIAFAKSEYLQNPGKLYGSNCSHVAILWIIIVLTDSPKPNVLLIQWFL